MRLQLFSLAWRNIWRNKRRANITIFSIAISLFFVLLLRQMQFWTYDFNIKNSISAYVGYIQITDSNYVDEEIIDNTILREQVPISDIEKIEGVTGVYPRFQSGALISSGIKSKFAGILGINPSTDNSSLKLDLKLIDGALLTEVDHDILITEKMSKFYKVGVNDSLVLLGQGYQGYTAAGLYRVKGILKFPAGDLANMVFMSIKECQNFHVAPNRYTSFLINVSNSKDVVNVEFALKNMVSDKSLAIRNWRDVLPGLSQGLDIDEKSGLLIGGILYMIVGFGIFGTIVMLYNERLFEFGVLNAIGMSRYDLILMTLLELIILVFIGVTIGILLSLPVLLYFNHFPYELGGDSAKSLIDQGFEPYIGMGLYFDVFLANAFMIFVISILVSSYIIFKLKYLSPLKAMRQ